MNPRPLSPKQQRFVDEYLLDLNASQAAIRAGYSARTAGKISWQLLGKTRIADAIARAKDARSRRTTITQDAVLYEIALLQHSSVDHYHIDDYGNVTLAPHAPPDALRAVASLKKKIVHLESGVSYETEIRLWNKPASLRMGGEHLGLFKGATTELPDIHVHVHAARDRLTARVDHLARRHAEDALNGS